MQVKPLAETVVQPPDHLVDYLLLLMKHLLISICLFILLMVLNHHQINRLSAGSSLPGSLRVQQNNPPFFAIEPIPNETTQAKLLLLPSGEGIKVSTENLSPSVGWRLMRPALVNSLLIGTWPPEKESHANYTSHNE